MEVSIDYFNLNDGKEVSLEERVDGLLKTNNLIKITETGITYLASEGGRIKLINDIQQYYCKDSNIEYEIIEDEIVRSASFMTTTAIVLTVLSVLGVVICLVLALILFGESVVEGASFIGLLITLVIFTMICNKILNATSNALQRIHKIEELLHFLVNKNK